MIAIDAGGAPDRFFAIASQVDEDPTELLDSLVPILQAGERDIFLSEVSPGGMPWEELSPVTVDAKGFSKILVKTGRLYESVVTPNGTSDTIWETSADPAYLIFGTSVPYAKYHQTGTRRMPARPFMGMNRKTEQEVVNAVADAAVKRITKEK